MFLEYLETYAFVFLIGGSICTIGQILIIKTNITSSRILVLFVVAGAILEALGLYEPLVQIGKAGATVPITGFGRSLAKGAIEGVKENGLLGIFQGGLTATAGGIACAVIFAYLFGLIFSSKTKEY